MSSLHLLYKKEYAINEFVKVMIPTVGDVLDHEDEYYEMVTMLTAMPVDMMVQLDDIGVDFTTINEWELFLLFFIVFFNNFYHNSSNIVFFNEVV